MPEHFNFPWHFAIDEGAFEQNGIEVEWIDIPEGTGKMCQLLREGFIDLAVILTEGIVKDITNGNPSKIVQKYIASPLLWGIHVDKNSDHQQITDLEGKTAAISRYGSGSHLMAYINASQQGWDTASLNFEVVNTIDGAITALKNGTADYFMWEHFTTKPLVDNGTFRRIADCPTPWPCFVIAANNEFIKTNRALISYILSIINSYTSEFKNIPSIDRTLANAYHQDIYDIKKWLSITKWSQNQIESDTILQVQEQLFRLNLIDKKVAASTFISN